MREHKESYKRRLEILENILRQEFHLETREKIEELIEIYQEYVTRKNQEEKERKKIILLSKTSHTPNGTCSLKIQYFS